ncbi:MAG: glutamine amidotransferase [Patescibacteria group bacterium]
MKQFLILQLRPEDETSDNEYEAFLKFGGLKPEETKRIRIEKAGIPDDIDPHDYAAILVGGSPFDISTPAAEKSEIQNKIEADFKKLFDVVVAEDIPFLGACSGNGLLGNYLGATISKQYGEPVGGIDGNITEEGKNDPLLKDFPGTIRVLVGHKEACDDVPPQATLLVRGDSCPVQMFRVGENVYATQFHPEADAAGFTVRINTYKHHGYFKPEEADDLIASVEQEATPYAQEILKRFVERYRAG